LILSCPEREKYSGRSIENYGKKNNNASSLKVSTPPSPNKNVSPSSLNKNE